VRPLSGIGLTVVLLAASWSIANTQQVFNPHADPNTGVLRVTTIPSTRGQCSQCHAAHGEQLPSGPQPVELFTDNNNGLCFTTDGDSPCHQARPVNYPLPDSDFMPETEPDAGYPEANAGGLRRVGVEFRGRWPGETVYNDPATTILGRYVSPHAFDSDMPRRDQGGQGLCLNCHDPHGTPNPFDLLRGSYRGIGGHLAAGPPAEYGHCFQCHGPDGPAGMDLENRYIADFYDPGLNGNAGHRIAMNPDIAISWPAYIQPGDMLPCYACHNPHGSTGHDGVQPNGFLLNDDRPEWTGLTDTLTDPEQSRRFCFGCHIPSDGIPGSKMVLGIVMNTIPDRGPHRLTSIQSCHDCHGRDYDRPNAENVHNPKH
jgi:cytochrome c553